MAGRLAWLPRVDRAFNLHWYRLLVEYGYSFAEAGWHGQIWTLDPWPEGMLMNRRQFPYEELLRMPRGNYHCGTFDWLVAYAIYLGATEISIYGVGLVLEPGEPISARACLEYWLGRAEGAGIKVNAPNADIFHFYHLVKSDLIYSLDNTPIYENARRPKSVPKTVKAPYKL